MSSEDIKITLEVINTLAIVIASIVAICGISAWRKEFQGKRNIELAEEVLALFYEAKDAISTIRRRPISQGEGSTRKPQEGETGREKQARDRAYAIYEQFDKRKDVFNKLHSKRYQFIARFGEEKAKPFDEIRHIANEILCAVNELAKLWCDVPYDQEDGKKLKEQKEKQEQILWYYGKCDPIKPRLEGIISDIEGICRPIIMGKSRKK